MVPSKHWARELPFGWYPGPSLQAWWPLVLESQDSTTNPAAQDLEFSQTTSQYLYV